MKDEILRRENEILKDISARLSKKYSYGIRTSFLNELAYLRFKKRMSEKTYKRIYRKFHIKTLFFNRETNLRFYLESGIAHVNFETEKEFLRNWITKNSKRINKNYNGEIIQ